MKVRWVKLRAFEIYEILLKTHCSQGSFVKFQIKKSKQI